MICINLCGGAAIGKSTLAAKLYARLKETGASVEIAGDYPKDLVYEKAYQVMDDTEYMFSLQAHRLKMLQLSGIEIAICDAPLMVVTAYGSYSAPSFPQYVLDTYNQYTNINILLTRPNVKVTDIRDGIIGIDDDHIENHLNSNMIQYERIDPCAPDAIESICNLLDRHKKSYVK